MITNTNVFECVARTGARYCLEYFDIAWLTMVKNIVLRTVSQISWLARGFRMYEQLWEQFSEAFGAASQLSISCPVD